LLLFKSPIGSLVSVEWHTEEEAQKEEEEEEEEEYEGEKRIII